MELLNLEIKKFLSFHNKNYKQYFNLCKIIMVKPNKDILESMEDSEIQTQILKDLESLKDIL